MSKDLIPPISHLYQFIQFGRGKNGILSTLFTRLKFLFKIPAGSTHVKVRFTWQTSQIRHRNLRYCHTTISLLSQHFRQHYTLYHIPIDNLQYHSLYATKVVKHGRSNLFIQRLIVYNSCNWGRYIFFLIPPTWGFLCQHFGMKSRYKLDMERLLGFFLSISRARWEKQWVEN